MKIIKRSLAIVFALSILTSLIVTRNLYYSTSSITESFEEDVSLLQICPLDMVEAKDMIVPSDTNKSIEEEIPRVIHFIVQTKCMKPQLYHQHFGQWKLHNRTIMFYDRNDINKLLDKQRPEFPGLENIRNCLMKSINEIDIAKLLLLWDVGGIVADINTKPTEAFLSNGILQETYEAFFFEDSDEVFRHEIMGGAKRHPIFFMMIQKAISNLYQQFADKNIYKDNEDERRSAILKFPINTFFPRAKEESKSLKRKGFDGISVTIFPYDANHHYTILDPNRNHIDFTQLYLQTNNNSPCVRFDTTYAYNITSLQEIAGSTQQYQCPSRLKLVEDKFYPQNGRKIPKLVHMTSKTRCLTSNFTENAQSWFFENHTMVFHDDDAVARLLETRFPEFPHLQYASKCITSGAGMADLWRYLVLWEYGGIYTDIDNAPGPKLFNGSVIHDDMEAFLEVEVGRFPSQYFIAISPHHPLMYFAVNIAMARLFEEKNIVQQYVPYITGPGALKAAMMFTVGDGYPTNGTHSGIYDRNVTMIGHRSQAKAREFINRGSVSNHEYREMNISHYSFAGRQKDKPRKPCLEVIYDFMVDD